MKHRWLVFSTTLAFAKHAAQLMKRAVQPKPKRSASRHFQAHQQATSPLVERCRSGAFEQT